jgi:hypothetical protein
MQIDTLQKSKEQNIHIASIANKHLLPVNQTFIKNYQRFI